MADKAKRKVGGGKKEAEPDQSEVRWLISYSDFMMQLVCLFILLYSVSSIDTTKAAQISESWREAQGLPPPNVSSVPPGNDQPPLTADDVPRAIMQIQVQLGRFPEGRSIRVSRTSDGFRLQLTYSMYDEGSGQFTADGARLLDLAALILKPFESRVSSIEIIGHTAPDDAETEGGSAMRLSLTRAREALKHVTRSDAPSRLDSARLTAAGRGPFEPAEDNSNSRTRVLNRRVDFQVHLVQKNKP
jgi:chemotaxis protein MotB